MAEKSLSAEQKFRAQVKFIRCLRRKAGRGNKGAGSTTKTKARLNSEIAAVWAEMAEKAFKDAQLDIDNEGHRFLLLCMMAWAFYFKRRRGRHTLWTPEEYHRLLAAFEARKSENPKLSELAICRLLVSDGSFAKHDPPTLRRTLQRAKTTKKLEATVL
jgi:hypothetical protein